MTDEILEASQPAVAEDGINFCLYKSSPNAKTVKF